MPGSLWCRIVEIQRNGWRPRNVLDRPEAYTPDRVLLSKTRMLLACSLVAEDNSARRDDRWAIVEQL